MEFLERLKKSGLKATPQRIAVLRELDKKNHPTMDEMYMEIKKAHPSISLATVYKNVNVLREEGIVIEINVPNGKMRYDYFTKPHIHMICKNCGNVRDMDYNENLFDYQNKLEKTEGVVIDRLDIIASIESCSLCK